MPQAQKRNHHGVTLLELLLCLVLMAFLAGALSYAFVAGLDMERSQAIREANRDKTDAFEKHLTQMLQGAMLTTDATDTKSYFL